MDCGAPQPLLRPATQLVDELGEALDRFPPNERLATAVTPRYILACSGALLSAAAELAADRKAIMQTHLAEEC